jgi:hypothetical protein
MILSYTKGRTDNNFANFVGETGGGVETARWTFYVEHKEWMHVQQKIEHLGNTTYRQGPAYFSYTRVALIGVEGKVSGGEVV